MNSYQFIELSFIYLKVARLEIDFYFYFCLDSQHFDFMFCQHFYREYCFKLVRRNNFLQGSSILVSKNQIAQQEICLHINFPQASSLIFISQDNSFFLHYLKWAVHQLRTRLKSINFLTFLASLVQRSICLKFYRLPEYLF